MEDFNKKFKQFLKEGFDPTQPLKKPMGDGEINFNTLGDVVDAAMETFSHQFEEMDNETKEAFKQELVQALLQQIKDPSQSEDDIAVGKELAKRIEDL